MTAASELKKQQTQEEKQIQNMLAVDQPGRTLEQLCFAAGNLDYGAVLSSDAIAREFPEALMNQAAHFRTQIRLQSEKLQQAHDMAQQASVDRLNLEIELEGLMARIAQVRQLQ